MIQFHDLNSTWVMRITADRMLEVNEDVHVTEAAKKVLEAMQGLLDAQPAQHEIARLHDRIKNLELDVEFLSRPAPVQEPEYIQLRHKEEDGFSPWGQPLDPKYRHDKWAAGVEMRLLYTSPQPAPRKPLTREQMYELSNKANDDCMRDSDSQAPWSARPWTYHFVRAIEAAHNIKENT